jgi:hypothetical protein
MCCAWLNIFLFYCLLIRSGMEHPEVKITHLCLGAKPLEGETVIGSLGSLWFLG